jgi:hypothetical protein
VPDVYPSNLSTVVLSFSILATKVINSCGIFLLVKFLMNLALSAFGKAPSMSRKSMADYFPASCRHMFGQVFGPLPFPPTHSPALDSGVSDSQFPHNVSFRRADWVNEPIPEDMYRFVCGASFATLPRIRHDPGSRGDKQQAKPNERTDVKSEEFKTKEWRFRGRRRNFRSTTSPSSVSYPRNLQR